MKGIIKKRGLFFFLFMSSGILILAFIVLPLIQLMSAPSFEMMKETIKDKDVLKAIWLSIYTALSASLIAFIFGTPLAYLLARSDFRGKRLVESIIDLPIVIPHPVVGIAILGVVGKNHWFGQLINDLGIRLMGNPAGIITVLTFVGLPFYINAAKEGFENISPRLENVSRSLGASMSGTFFRVTFPLARRSMLTGVLMCTARAISEFGAVVVIAYHPMIAPVLLYERYESYGLKYSQPISVWLVCICLTLFLALRVVTLNRKNEA
ncbi:MAG TPA: ABC transporter permease [Spirochaetota bacterium]|nr:ABC transporter permease [Spirochaetota bacterium]HPJ42741.1 ABC transporter permease [Spirochaetota bacterium]HPR38217.1 ABC transporter permease [Spirochaetota bacterium]